MKLKILVFDPEVGLRELLRAYLSGQGHEVYTFSDPTVCPVYRNSLDEACRCPQSAPCADVLLADFRLSQIDALGFMKLQSERGCLSLPENRAVVSSELTPARQRALAELGYHYIRKPFKLSEIGKWVRECAARVAAARNKTS